MTSHPDPATSHVVFSREGPIAILTLDRPAKLNALTLAMQEAIFRALHDFRTDKSLKVLILTGTGRAFCAGDDLGESDPRTGVIPAEDETDVAWHNMVREMRGIPKPIIAAVNGLACGAGGGLMLGTDIRIAADTARFADIFMRRGLVGGAYLLTQVVGTGRALELILTGEFIDAAEGHRLGIFNRVVPADRLMAETLAFAKLLAGGPSEAVGLSKLTVYGVANLALNEGLRAEATAKLLALRGAGVREGIAAFNDKRRANFAEA